MPRNQIIGPSASTSAPTAGEIDIAAVVTVLVIAEAPGDPVGHAFASKRSKCGTTRCTSVA